MVRQMGERFRWLSASPCTCYDPTTNDDRERSCGKCERGQLYTDKGEQRGLVASLKRSVLHPDVGWVQQGELTLTTMPDEVLFGQWDKVVLLDREALARERVRRGGDTLPHPNPVRVLAVRDQDATYLQGRDFTFAPATGEITWLTEGPTGLYSVEYLYHPTYWHIGLDVRPPRPSGCDLQTPQRGLLSLAPPAQ